MKSFAIVINAMKYNDTCYMNEDELYNY